MRTRARVHVRGGPADLAQIEGAGSSGIEDGQSGPEPARARTRGTGKTTCTYALLPWTDENKAPKDIYVF